MATRSPADGACSSTTRAMIPTTPPSGRRCRLLVGSRRPRRSRGDDSTATAGTRLVRLHFSIGHAVDPSSDQYNLDNPSTVGQYMGSARDGSIAMFIDGDGNDRAVLSNRTRLRRPRLHRHLLGSAATTATPSPRYHREQRPGSRRGHRLRRLSILPRRPDLVGPLPRHRGTR